MKKNNKGFSLVELIVVVLIMAIIATALTLAVTKYVAKSKRSADANTAGELKTAAETAVTDYLTTKGIIVSTNATGNGTIKINSNTMTVDTPSGTDSGFSSSDFQDIFQEAAGTAAQMSKVHPGEHFVVTITVKPGDIASYKVAYSGAAHSLEDIFENGTK